MDFTYETILGFEGPNLCLLGNEGDFLQFSKTIVEITGRDGVVIDLLTLACVTNVGDNKRIFFSSNEGDRKLGTFDDTGNLIFQLDYHYWERIFKYFILMSWSKSTYYLNEYENCLSDL